MFNGTGFFLLTQSAKNLLVAFIMVYMNKLLRETFYSDQSLRIEMF